MKTVHTVRGKLQSGHLVEVQIDDKAEAETLAADLTDSQITTGLASVEDVPF